MSNSTSKDIVGQVIAHAKKQLKPKALALFEPFVRQFFANVAYEDLCARSTGDLYCAAFSQWELIYERKPNERKIEVHNPQAGKHEWQSTHTIVEIVYEDMPFLVDSITMEINRMGFTCHLIIHTGGMKFKRNKDGQVQEVFPQGSDENIVSEALVYMEIDRQTDPKVLADLRKNLERILKDVHSAVSHWRKMRKCVQDITSELENTNAPLPKAELEESAAFLKWLCTDHFTFLGVRDYEMVKEGKEKALRIISGSGLGVLADDSASKMSRYYSDLPPEARKLALSKEEILIISKTNTRSTVHRPTYTDYIGIKRFNSKGEIIGELRVIGLYTSDAYNSNLQDIPVLRLRVKRVLEESRLPHKSHAERALLNILENLPRDDLFQATSDQLYELGMGILQLQERRRIKLFVRKDPYGRFMSCLVYVPRDNFNTELLYKMRDILQDAFSGVEVSFSTYFPESVLARIHFVIRIDPKKQLKYDFNELEQKLVEVGRSWSDDLREELIEFFGEERGASLIPKYVRAFPSSYREAFPARAAAFDIENIERLVDSESLEMSFYRSSREEEGVIRFKLFRYGKTVPLSDALPMLENLGLRVIGEEPYMLRLQNKEVVWINDFHMAFPFNELLNVEAAVENFQNAFYHVWCGAAENDSFNELVLKADLTWREIAVLRAYAKYMRQAGSTFSQAYIEEALNSNSNIAILLIKLFILRFDPSIKRHSGKAFEEYKTKIEDELEHVANLDHDRTLRHYLNLIAATLRTNYFQLGGDGKPHPYISFKFDSKRIPGLPLPHPMFEVFVYSPRFEAIHLRSAKVARGGLRWSDRREDFRTEVLGLVKAQQVKNAVIVPSGAKGGFVAKCLPVDGSRDDIFQEATNCYKGFIRGLLDITDNLVGGAVARPKEVVCYDDADPYLVVAADKGTATLSDTANAIAQEYNFWLGDAFASGGSTGYDHKKMGITAKGAWESVKRHFNDMGFNTQKTDFTVVGIGDMSGDVFGNGMLLSNHIKLIAAFNHLHIFIDPNPDAATSFKERERLFKLPRSTWEDYDPSLMSRGGGVYKRSAKAVPVSKEVKALLGIKKDAVTPSEMVRKILTAPVDLIWNGGIGTYVKASTESNASVGDRTNDAVRVNANYLQARVVGEGGNLGFTQLARIEFELNGGRINTDFIDNSGGVDCSDYEVNIKILLNNVVVNSEMTEKQRNQLLAKMTDEVSELVVHNNYRQARAIGIMTKISHEYLNLFMRYMSYHEEAGRINRELEFLPDDKTLLERKAEGKAFTRPEIAVLLAYSKIILKGRILDSNLPDDPHLWKHIEVAYPKELGQRYEEYVENHYLRREIIATQISNSLVTHMGIAFVFQMQEETGAAMPDIIRSYEISRHIFSLLGLWRQIEALDNKVDVRVQVKMMRQVTRLMRRATRWFLRHRRHRLDITDSVEQFAKHINNIRKQLPKLLKGSEKEQYETTLQKYLEANVPQEHAQRVAAMGAIYSTLNIIEAADKHDLDVMALAKVYFELTDRLELLWFHDHINKYPVDNRWSVLARAAFKADLDWQQRAFAVGVLQTTAKAKDTSEQVDAWFKLNERLIRRWRAILAELKTSSATEFAMLAVAVRELLDLAQSCLNGDSSDV